MAMVSVFDCRGNAACNAVFQYGLFVEKIGSLGGDLNGAVAYD
jgi:hypothetical protein